MSDIPFFLLSQAFLLAPESPVHLLKKKEESRAEEALRKLRAGQDKEKVKYDEN